MATNDAAEAPRLFTAGVIAELLGERIHRVLRVLNTRPHIRPRARAGKMRLYTPETVEAVRRELAEIDLRRGDSKKPEQSAGVPTNG